MAKCFLCIGQPVLRYFRQVRDRKTRPTLVITGVNRRYDRLAVGGAYWRPDMA